MAITMDARNGAARSALRVVPGGERLARAFRRAQRHSLLVRLLRVAFPLGALALAGYYALTLGVSWHLGAGRLNVGEVQLTADDLTMKNPSYFGLTQDGGRYEVRAKKAIVEFNRDAPIKLIDIDGDLVQVTNVTTKLKAKHGLLDNAKSELELFDGIEIEGSNGLKARLQRAKVFSKEHRVVSKDPVDVLMPTGRVRGSSMTLRTDTKESTFVGNVKVNLTPAAQPGAASPATPAFGADSRQPVDVTADQLYVNDTAKTALFTGNVVAVQGDSTLKAPELHIAYEGNAAADLTAAGPAPQGQEASRLSRLVAKNGARMTMGADRRVSSEEAQFDAKADTALFLGGVVVNQLRNVLQGRRLLVDRKAGTSRLDSPAEADQPAGRIAATFYQNEAGKPAAKPKPKAADVLQEGTFGSFKTDPNAPIDIEADTLDVNDLAKEAVFHGNVKSQQGDFVVRTVEMKVFYSGQTGLGMAGSEAAPAGKDKADKAQAQLTRVEARQKVLIVSKDGQSASGDWAIFDLKANTVLLGDHVVISRGKDVAEGPRLKLDLTTGMYRFEIEQEAGAPGAPAVSASPPVAPVAPGASPVGRACPPGKQCLLFYPKEAQGKATEAVKKALPESNGGKPKEGWQPGVSASPPMRSN